jgi:hypothetical protein
MEALCRICFEGADEGDLRHPCRCTGSVGSVHEHCLRRWLDTRGGIANPRCELCHTPYLFLYDTPWEDTQYANALCDSLWSNIGFHFFTQYLFVVISLFLNIHITTYDQLLTLQLTYHLAYIAGFGFLFRIKVQTSARRYARAFFNAEHSTFCAAYCVLWVIASFRCNGQWGQFLALITVQTFLSLFPYFHHKTLCTLNQSRTRRLLEWREN